MTSKRGFNYAFRLYMEGTRVPFKGATIVCTPNGVEANINVYSNKEILDLKPKTAIQIFYQEWDKTKDAPWRLMFDGFFSSFYKTDQATEGRGIGLVCRDFRMDIRRAPAAIAWEGAQDLTTRHYYNSMGIFQTFTVKGKNKSKETDIRIYGNTGLNPLSHTLSLIAGTAGYGKTGKKSKAPTYTTPKQAPADLSTDDALRWIAAQEKKDKKQKDGDSAYSADSGGSATTDKNNVTNCGFYLDAIIRGLWTEAIGGTSVSAFLNKRIRVDKRFLVPVNKSGYNFWNRQKGNVNISSHLMGNARFSSLEAAIMRLAGAFSTRVYSCNTPSLIPIGDDEEGKPNKAVKYVMDEGVRKFLVNTVSSEFGAKYILNESMLLPPLEFTAPPNCNLFFPPMYDRVEWRYDIDADVTRGYYSQTHLLSTPQSSELASISYQVPNALFNMMKETKKTDKHGRVKPPLTLEERYKGVNVAFGSVSYELAANDAVSVIKDRQVNAKTKKKLEDDIVKLEERKEAAESSILVVFSDEMKQQITDKKTAIKNLRASQNTAITKHTKNALKHHALLKFLNSKYQGRVVSVDMAFNPNVMCGFPGAIIVDDAGYGEKSGKTIIGTVQQVKHTIFITPNQAEANTSVAMNNARFEDEATDMDGLGSPLYMKATDPLAAELNIKTLEYWGKDSKQYYPPEPKAPVKRILNSEYYDLQDETGLNKDYIYAKDLLSLTAEDVAKGERNQIYIDEVYEPTRIAKFYREVFGHKEDSFMVGNVEDPRPQVQEGERLYFMYDTIHEALKALRTSRKELLRDYDACIKYTARNICSADAFYQGILGLSIRVEEDDENGKKVTKYKNIQDNFVDHRLEENYYGVTSDLYDSGKVDGLKTANDGTMPGPGHFSSIREHMPVTAFIKERREIVGQYKASVMQKVSGTQYSPVY